MTSTQTYFPSALASKLSRTSQGFKTQQTTKESCKEAKKKKTYKSNALGTIYANAMEPTGPFQNQGCTNSKTQKAVPKIEEKTAASSNAGKRLFDKIRMFKIKPSYCCKKLFSMIRSKPQQAEDTKNKAKTTNSIDPNCQTCLYCNKGKYPIDYNSCCYLCKLRFELKRSGVPRITRAYRIVFYKCTMIFKTPVEDGEAERQLLEKRKIYEQNFFNQPKKLQTSEKREFSEPYTEFNFCPERSRPSRKSSEQIIETKLSRGKSTGKKYLITKRKTTPKSTKSLLVEISSHSKSKHFNTPASFDESSAFNSPSSIYSTDEIIVEDELDEHIQENITFLETTYGVDSNSEIISVRSFHIYDASYTTHYLETQQLQTRKPETETELRIMMLPKIEELKDDSEEIEELKDEPDETEELKDEPDETEEIKDKPDEIEELKDEPDEIEELKDEPDEIEEKKLETPKLEETEVEKLSCKAIEFKKDESEGCSIKNLEAENQESKNNKSKDKEIETRDQNVKEEDAVETVGEYKTYEPKVENTEMPTTEDAMTDTPGIEENKFELDKDVPKTSQTQIEKDVDIDVKKNFEDKVNEDPVLKLESEHEDKREDGNSNVQKKEAENCNVVPEAPSQEDVCSSSNVSNVTQSNSSSIKEAPRLNIRKRFFAEGPTVKNVCQIFKVSKLFGNSEKKVKEEEVKSAVTESSLSEESKKQSSVSVTVDSQSNIDLKEESITEDNVQKYITPSPEETLIDNFEKANEGESPETKPIVFESTKQAKNEIVQEISFLNQEEVCKVVDRELIERVDEKNNFNSTETQELDAPSEPHISESALVQELKQRNLEEKASELESTCIDRLRVFPEIGVHDDAMNTKENKPSLESEHDEKNGDYRDDQHEQSLVMESFIPENNRERCLWHLLSMDEDSGNETLSKHLNEAWSPEFIRHFNKSIFSVNNIRKELSRYAEDTSPECLFNAAKVSFNNQFNDQDVQEHVIWFDSYQTASCVKAFSANQKAASRSILKVKASDNSLAFEFIAPRRFKLLAKEDERKLQEEKAWGLLDELRKSLAGCKGKYDIAKMLEQFNKTFEFCRIDFTKFTTDKIMEYMSWIANIGSFETAAMGIVSGVTNEYMLLLEMIQNSDTSNQSIDNIERRAMSIITLLTHVTIMLSEIEEAVHSMRLDLNDYFEGLIGYTITNKVIRFELLEIYNIFCNILKNPSKEEQTSHYTGHAEYMKENLFLLDNEAKNFETDFGKTLMDLQDANDIVGAAKKNIEALAKATLMKLMHYKSNSKEN